MTTAAGSGKNAVPGRVVANYGRRLLVEDSDGQRILCVPRGRRLDAVCGDRVEFSLPHARSQGVVLARGERQSALTRPNSRGHTETIAANMTQLCCVVAATPQPDWALVDRYLAAAAIAGLRACIVMNKSDLAESAEPGHAAELEQYRNAGFNTYRVSAHKASSLKAFAACLGDQVSILVGQSGVGKSSLLNALIPGLEAATAAVSQQTGAGRHTTTVSMLHSLPGGGEIIDSPGVRDFAPVVSDPADVIRGFPEIDAFTGHCRFTDCRHLAEPQCAARQAIESGKISKRRFASYVAMRQRADDLLKR